MATDLEKTVDDLPGIGGVRTSRRFASTLHSRGVFQEKKRITDLNDLDRFLPRDSSLDCTREGCVFPVGVRARVHVHA